MRRTSSSARSAFAAFEPLRRGVRVAPPDQLVLRIGHLAVEEALRRGDALGIHRVVDACGARCRTDADLTLQARGDVGSRAQAPGTGAQMEQPCEQCLRLERRGAAAKWPEVAARAVHTPRDRQTRKRVLGRELEERDLRQVLAQAVVGRLATPDLLRLAQRGLQLGAHDLDIDLADVANQIEHFAPVGGGVAQVAADALAQVLRLADVQQTPVLTGEAVDAGSLGQCGDACTSQMADEAPAVAGPVLKVEQFAEAQHPVAAQQLAELKKDLDGHARVAERAVSIDDRNTEVSGQRVERAPAQARQEAAGQAQRAAAGLFEDLAAQRQARGIQERDIEAGVVGDEHGAGRELDETRQHHRDGRPLGQHVLGDAGELGDEVGQAASGVYELGELSDDATALDAQRADLDDAVAAARRAAGGLEVDDDEWGLVEAAGERGMGGGDPTPGRLVKREARVAGEESADEARAELLVGARLREDEV